jgi:trehalose utilization protein
MTIKVTVWNEHLNEDFIEEAIKAIPEDIQAKARGFFEKMTEEVKNVYPEGIHGALKNYLGEEADFEVTTATLDQPEHGLSDEVLNNTDVLLWWGHIAHDKVSDEIVEKVYNRVLSGMGLIVLHSGHHSKIFRKLMGTTCSLNWREAGEKSRVWVIEPSHPIAEGIGEYIELEHEEMYGERFDIPTPDELVFMSWYKGGEVFRSGCCWTRGYGKVFYFSPGHETYSSFYNEKIIRVIKNAVRWAKPRVARTELGCPNVQPLEKLD